MLLAKQPKEREKQSDEKEGAMSARHARRTTIRSRLARRQKGRTVNKNEKRRQQENHNQPNIPQPKNKKQKTNKKTTLFFHRRNDSKTRPTRSWWSRVTSYVNVKETRKQERLDEREKEERESEKQKKQETAWGAPEPKRRRKSWRKRREKMKRKTRRRVRRREREKGFLTRKGSCEQQMIQFGDSREREAGRGTQERERKNEC